MAVLLTYDVDSKHVEIKAQLVASYGYTKTIDGYVMVNGNTSSQKAQSDLPNTTLYHSSKTVDEAAADIKAVVSWASATLEKYLAFEVVPNNWRAQSSRLG